MDLSSPIIIIMLKYIFITKTRFNEHNGTGEFIRFDNTLNVTRLDVFL